jgi:hypothetical protein
MKTSEPIFGCADCYEERSYFADELAWYKGQLFCEDCWSERLYNAEEDAGLPAFEDLEPFVPEYEKEIKALRAKLEAAMNPYLWRNEPPTREGEFFYNGKTPDRSVDIAAIVHVVMNEELHALTAFLLIPPYWRGDKNRACAKLHFGTLDEWEGQWAGPEFGLCSIEHANRAR